MHRTIRSINRFERIERLVWNIKKLLFSTSEGQIIIKLDIISKDNLFSQKYGV